MLDLLISTTATPKLDFMVMGTPRSSPLYKPDLLLVHAHSKRRMFVPDQHPLPYYLQLCLATSI